MADDSGRRKPRLAASLPVSPRRPLAGLGHDIWGPVPGVDAFDPEAGRQPLTLVAGNSWSQMGASVEDLGAGWARGELRGQMVRAPRVSVPSAGSMGDLPKVARQLSLQVQEEPLQATSLFAQYAASLGVSLTFHEDQLAGEGREQAHRPQRTPTEAFLSQARVLSVWSQWQLSRGLAPQATAHLVPAEKWGLEIGAWKSGPGRVPPEH